MFRRIIWLFVLCAFFMLSRPAQAQMSFKYVGVNMHDVGKYDAGQIDQAFSYLSQCGVNVVRMFGTPGNGGVGGINNVAAVAGRHGIQLIVAVADFANAGADVGFAWNPGTIAGWYSAGYQGAYMNYIRSIGSVPNVLSFELGNEPHCLGVGGCRGPFKQWVTDASRVLAASGAKVSVGDAIQPGDDVDNPMTGGWGDFNSVSTITQTTGHFYPATEPEKRQHMQKAAEVAQSLGKEIILGEIGLPCDGDCFNADNQVRASKLVNEMQAFSGYGYDGFVYWLFGGFKGGPTFGNDQYAWFANAGDVNDPMCVALREGKANPLPGTTGLPQSPADPVFIYPKTTDELKKYMTNTAAYCAPKQIYNPEGKEQPPDLNKCYEAASVRGEEPGNPYSGGKIILNDDICNQYEYPIRDTKETWYLNSNGVSHLPFAFPLFRDQEGGISIEADLSRIKPNDTLFTAAARNDRANAAPQFYLTSPETQCLNAVRYLAYVEKACVKYSKSLVTCEANIEVTLPNGEKKKILEGRSALPSEAICADFGKEISNNTELAKWVRSINPHTPKVFKIGFVVQHTWFHREDFITSAYYLIRQMTLWFTSTRFPNIQPINPYPGEKLDIVPVWYHAGLAVDQYDQYQTQQPYAFNPDQATEAVLDPTFTPPKFSDNFVSSWIRTYQLALPLHTQDQIGQKRWQEVYRNKTLIDKIYPQIGNIELGGVSDPVTHKNILRPAIDCWGQQCLCYPPGAGVSEPDRGFPQEQCPNQPLKQLQDAFPENFTPDQEYVTELKKLVIARINAGVEWPDAKNPPNTQRIYGCPVDQLEIGAVSGESETAKEITLASQQRGVKEWIGSIVTGVRAKMLFPGGSGAGLPDDTIPYPNAKSPRTYIILPEEAMNIQITQAMVTPMFLSPEMYESIVSGKNPIYPFQEAYEAKRNGLVAKGLPEWQLAFIPKETFLSPLLRTTGYDRELPYNPGGYSSYKVKRIEYSTRRAKGCVGSDADCCEIGNPIREEDLGYMKRPNDYKGAVREKWWIELGSYSGQAATCQDPNEYLVEEEGPRSLVSLEPKDNDAIENPNPNPMVPGKLAALNEYLRRMAFTPDFMQKPFTKYPGLEPYYLNFAKGASGSGTLGSNTAPPGTQASATQCVYQDGEVVQLQAIKNNNDLASYICQQAGDPIVAALVRALWDVEGGAARNALRSGSASYECSVNSAGAVGPMGQIVDQCRAGFTPSGTQDVGYNTRANDLCTIEGAITRGISKASNNIAETSLSSIELKVAYAASRYYGRVGADPSDPYDAGNACGDLRDPYDGATKPCQSNCSADNARRDYCGYIQAQFQQYRSMCQ